MRFRAAEPLDRAGIDPRRLSVALPTVDPSDIVVRPASRWFRRTWARGITAVAMPWGIYLAPDRIEQPDPALARLMVHELTHIDQWRRLGPFGWTRAYVGDYLRGRWSGLSHREAYLAIGLEREARDVARRLAG
jgi:hypothetical protein